MRRSRPLYTSGSIPHGYVLSAEFTRREYSPRSTLRGILVAVLLCALLLACGCASQGERASSSGTSQDSLYTTLISDFHNTDLGCGWEPTGSMELDYATCFAVDYYPDGFALVCTADGGRYLVVPEGKDAPKELASDIQLIQQPVGNIYLAASDSMCLFDALGALDRICASGIERDDWHIDAARAAMDKGDIVFGGKYRAPDYELLVSSGVRLAIESSMINHTPEVREKLMDLGIPVLTELSSYEKEPLGRAEWIRLYGMLCGLDSLAQEVFDKQVAQARSFDASPTNKTVAFFYLNANGAAVVRRPGDYVTSMIEEAGGHSVFEGLEEAATGSSSTTMEMEQFYAAAKDADLIIYNATIDEPLASVEELVQKNALLADFKAVQTGDVWLCDQNMYQKMIATGDIIADIHKALSGENGDLTYLRRLI